MVATTPTWRYGHRAGPALDGPAGHDGAGTGDLGQNQRRRRCTTGTQRTMGTMASG